MRKIAFFAWASGWILGSAGAHGAQNNAGSLEFEARIMPTQARPEPVRQMTFYILKRSYAEILKELAEKDPAPSRDAFIDGLKVSPEMRKWFKAHENMDLAQPDLDKTLTQEEILGTPELLQAYQRANSGGATNGFPQAKFSEADKTERPEKYEKQKQEYTAAIRKFLLAHPETVTGIELELAGINPQSRWTALQNERRKRLLRAGPETAQLFYLAGKADTDLEGHARAAGLPAGQYWISTLNLDAAAGDVHLKWDVGFEIRAGQTTRVELTNLNATDAQASHP